MFMEETFDQVLPATLVVVDAGVKDHELLLGGVVDSASILLLDPHHDGVEQITQALAKRQVPVQNLYVFSHGSPGTLYLGNACLSLDTLAHYASQLSQWFEVVPNGAASLLIYGCQVASGDAGSEFIDKLGKIAQANVAASSRLVGSPQTGGSWSLDVFTGDIHPYSDRPQALTAQAIAAYASTFTPGTTPPFSPTDTVTGEITASDPDNPTRVGTKWDLFLLSGVTSGQTVSLYMDDGTLSDPYLQVVDASGNLVAQDDDAGDSLDAQLSFIYQPGYVIRATTYSQGATGTYTLHTSAGSFNTVPTVSSVVPSLATITNSDVGSSAFSLTITYSELMDTSVNPTIAFPTQGEDPSSNLTFASGSWIDGTTYIATFDVSGPSTSTADIDVEVSGAQSLSGVSQNTANSIDIFSIAIATDSDGGLFASDIVSEPISLAAENDTEAEAVALFDFVIADGGTSDGLDLTVTAVQVDTVGSTGDPSQVTWLLSGTDLTTDVVGTYDSTSGFISFSLTVSPITITNGQQEAYTVKAYTSGTVSSGDTFNLSIDGDRDLTVEANGTQMGTTETITNGSGSVVTVLPAVQSISLNDPSPTNANQVNYTVTFNQAVSGVDTSDFSLNAAIGIEGASIAGVNGSGDTYIVTVNTGTGEGALRLDVADNDTIRSLDTNTPLGGSGFGNGGYNDGPAYTLDRTAPAKPAGLALSSDTDSGAAGDQVTNNTQPSITGTAAAGTTITVRDANSNVIGTATTAEDGTFTAPLSVALAEGGNTLSVTATDPAGNESVATQVTVTLDTQAPLGPTEVDLTGESDTGVTGDQITNVATPTLTGRAEANSDITIRDAADAVLGTGTADGLGNWSIQLTKSLETGSNTLFLTATDAAGNTTMTATEISITFDGTVDPAPTARLDDSANSGQLADSITNVTTPVISGTAEPGSNVTVFLPDGQGGEIIYGTGTADAVGDWSITLNQAFADGPYTLDVRVIDVAGNQVATDVSFTIDSTDPVVPTVASLTTNNNKPILTGTYGGGTDGLEVTVSDGVRTETYTLADAELTSDATLGTWTLNLGGLATELADNTYEVTATATDIAGNISADTSTGELIVDTQPPAVPQVDGLITNDTTPIITGTYEPGNVLTVTVGQLGPFSLGDPQTPDAPELTANDQGGWMLDLSNLITPLAEGTYDITATVTDAAGNSAIDPNSGELVIDTTAPAAPVADLDDVTGSNSGSVEDTVTNVSQPTISGTAEANSTVTINYGDSSQSVETATGDWSIALEQALSEGANTLSITTTDAAGNQSVATPLEITLDTTVEAPSALLSALSDSGVEGDNLTNLTNPVITGTTEPGARVTVYQESVSPDNLIGSATADAQTGEWSFTASNLSEGQNNLLFIATDLADNASTATPLSVTVDQTAPSAPTVEDAVNENTGRPTITGTFDEAENLTVAIAGTELSYSLQDAELNSDGNGNWTLDLSNIATPIATGTYNVVATAVDAAGNTSVDTSTGELTIDITPPQAPTVNSQVTSNRQPIITGTFDPTDTAEFSVEVNGQVYRLGVDAVLSVVATSTWELDLTNVVNLTDGAYDVVATAVDGAGNTITDANGDTPDLIVDATAPGTPSIALASGSDSGIQGDNITNDTTPTLEGSAEANATVTIVGSGIDTAVTADANGQWSFTPTTALPGGEATFTVSAVDAAGNASGSASLTINVDLTAPIAPEGLDLLDDSGVSATDNLTSDNTPRIFGTAEAGTTVELFNGTTSLGTTSADAQGQWTITSAALAGNSAGIEYGLTATATDSVGNVSTASTPLTIVVDTGVDRPSVPDLLGEDDTGISDSDNITNLTQPKFTGIAEPGSTVTVRSNRNGVLGTVVADASTGEWTLSDYSIQLTSATHSITVQATDLAGNISTVSNALTLTVDTANPSAPSTPNLTAATDSGRLTSDNITNVGAAQFVGTAASNTIVTLFSNIDGELGSVATENFSWSFTVGDGGTGFPSALSEGSHEITAIATDLAGNQSVLSNLLTVEVDFTIAAPTIDSIATDTGVLNNDGITSDRTLVVNGTAEANSTVQVLLNGEAVGTASVNSSGSWSFSYATQLADGDYVLNAVATDIAGNRSEASEPYAVTIDATGPAAPTIVNILEDTGLDPSDGITNSQNLVVNGTAEAGTTVDVLLDGAIIGTVSADSVGDWSLNYTATTLAEGSYVLTAQATDTAGNQSDPSVNFDLTVDTTTVNPTVTSISEDSGNSDGDGLTSDTTPQFFGTAEAGAEITLSATSIEGTVLLGTTTADENGDWSYQVTAALADNEYTITAEATDVAGNQTVVVDAFSLTVDSTAPQAPSQPFLEVTDDQGLSEFDNITNVNTPTFGGNAEPNALIQLFNNDTLIGETTTDEFGSWTFTVPADSPLGDGEYSLTAVSTDSAGNVSAVSAALLVEIDTAAPVAPSGLQIAAENDSGISNSDGVTNNVSPTILGAAEAGSLVELFLQGTQGLTKIGEVFVGQDGSWQIPVEPPVDDGTYDFVATATDTAGNVSELSSALSIQVDTSVEPAVAFSLSSDSDPEGDSLISNALPTFEGVVEPGSTVTLSSNLDGNLGSVTADAQGSWTFTASSALSDGNHVITAFATDVAGNEIGNFIEIEVDTVPPQAPTNLDLTPASDSGASDGDNITNLTTPVITGTAEVGADVTLMAAFEGGEPAQLGTVQADGSGTWSFTPSTALSQGSYVFTAMTRDAAGNVAASGELSVVIDVTSPTTPTNLALDAASDTGAQDNITSDTTPTLVGTADPGIKLLIRSNGNLVGETLADANGEWTFTLAEVDALTDGSYEFTAQAVDVAGNLSTVTAPLTVVIDSTPPPAPSIPDLIAASDTGSSNTDNITQDSAPTFVGTAEANAEVELFANGSSLGVTSVGNDGNWSFTVSDSTPLGDGVIEISTRVTGASGLSSDSEALLITVDTEAPTTPTLAAILEESGAAPDEDGLLSDNTLLFSGTASAGETVDLQLNGTSIGTATADASGSWTLDYQGTVLADGDYTLSLASSDLAGNTAAIATDTSFTIDTTAPTVTGVTAPSTSGSFRLTDTVEIWVNFDEAVTVTGAPTLELLVGETAQTASYVSGSGSTTLVFNYAVQSGEFDQSLSYASETALQVGTGAITDVTGNSAVLTLATPGAQNSLEANTDLSIVGGAVAPGNAYFNYRQYQQYLQGTYGSSVGYTFVEEGGIALDLLFDETYYLASNPDVADAVNAGALASGYQHFIQSGRYEGRNPSSLFNETYYLTKYSDVAEAVANGLVSSGFEHFVRAGHLEGRDPSALFSQSEYLTRYGDIQAGVEQELIGSGFEHFVEFGAAEGRIPGLSLFTEAVYLEKNPDVAAAVQEGFLASGFQHYISNGQREARTPSLSFNNGSYLDLNPDVADAVEQGAFPSGFAHYIQAGRAEGRSVYA